MKIIISRRGEIISGVNNGWRKAAIMASSKILGGQHQYRKWRGENEMAKGGIGSSKWRKQMKAKWRG
jgi:hypothetical protein